MSLRLSIASGRARYPGATCKAGRRQSIAMGGQSIGSEVAAAVIFTKSDSDSQITGTW